MLSAVDSGFLVANECMAMMSAMRKSSRQAHSGIAAILGTQNEDSDETLSERLGLRTPSKANVALAEHPLIWRFAKLRSEIEANGLQNLGVIELTAPFIAVIKAPNTTGVITSLALTALEKMIVLHIINSDMPDIGDGLYKIAMAITNCRFKASDQYEDDAVLVQLMGVLDKIIASDLGLLLCNEAVCEVVETCLSMACQMRRGDALRRSVVSTVTGLIRLVFSQLPMDDEGTGEFGDDELNIESPLPQTDISNGSTVGTSFIGTETATDSDGQNTELGDAQSSRAQAEKKAEAEAAAEAKIDTVPFSTPAILETFRVLVSITNPQSQHDYTDSTRVMVLRILRVCFEVAGRAIAKHPSFVSLISAHLFKYLAQLIRREHPALVYESLQLVGLLMETGGRHYKLQQEFILVYILTALTPLTDLPRDTTMDDVFYDGIVPRPACVKAPGPNAVLRAPEIREIMVETLTRFSHGPAFFPLLFANYDCDTSQTDLCQDLVGFLCRSAYPDTATWSTAAVPPLCLEAVLALLQRMAARALHATGEEPEAVSEAVARKQRKDVEILVTNTFNESPARGIKLMLEHDVIPDKTPEAIAAFLRSSRRLHKGELGRFLAKPANKDVLKAFIDGFDFSDKRIDEALREFLCCFRLPGESGEIEPIFERFSEHYVAGGHHDAEVSNADAAFVLSYAVIMLNTDQHSPQVRRRMEFDAFKNNLRGANGGKDFDESFLREIYTTIKHREIVLPDEHDTDETFEYAWRELQLALPQASEYQTEVSPFMDRHVFTTSWRPIVSTLSFIFATATDDVVFSRVITGFRQAADLAAKFSLGPALDHIVRCLAKISTLASGDLTVPKSNLCVAIYRDDGSTYDVIVSDLSSAFGSDLKAQMASITMFRILSDVAEAGALQTLSEEGWKIFVRVIANLYIYDLFVPPGLKRVSSAYRFERGKAGRNVGIFSALSSYLTSNPDIPSEPSDEEVDAALGAQDCIAACDVMKVVESIIQSAGNNQKTAETAVEGIMAVLPGPEPQYAASRRMLLELALLMAKGKPALAASIASACCEAGISSDDGLVPLQAALIANETSYIDQVLGGLETADGLFELEELPVQSSRLWELVGVSELEPAVEFAVNNCAEVGPAQPAALQTLSQLATRGSPEALTALHDSFAKVSEKQFEQLDTILQPCYLAPSGKIREQAIVHVQSQLLQDDVVAKLGSWQQVFGELLVNLLENLLKPDVFSLDPKGMERTRQQAAVAAGKVFLHNAMASDTELDKPWKDLLRVLDRLLSSRRQPGLEETVPEMLKNIVLVMRMAGQGSDEFWSDSERQLRGFVPEVAVLIYKQPESTPIPHEEPQAPPAVTPELEKSAEPETAKPETDESVNPKPDEPNSGEPNSGEPNSAESESTKEST